MSGQLHMRHTSLAVLRQPNIRGYHSETSKLPGGLSSFTTVGGSLAVVLGIFLLIVWVLRRASPGGAGILPAEAFEMLGRAPLANHQQVHLLRCGNKLLLVAVAAAGAAPRKTLTEITDPAEVDRLAGLCRRARARQRPTATFRQVFRPSGGTHMLRHAAPRPVAARLPELSAARPAPKSRPARRPISRCRWGCPTG